MDHDHITAGGESDRQRSAEVLLHGADLVAKRTTRGVSDAADDEIPHIEQDAVGDGGGRIVSRAVREATLAKSGVRSSDTWLTRASAVCDTNVNRVASTPAERHPRFAFPEDARDSRMAQLRLR